MKKMLIGIIILAIIVIASIILFQNNGTPNLEYDSYVFDESLTSGFGTSPASSLSYEIKGIITDVKFFEEYIDPCISSEDGCPTDYNPVSPAHYKVRVYIQEIQEIQNDRNYGDSCDHSVGSYTIFSITEEDVDEIPTSQQQFEAVTLEDGCSLWAKSYSVN